MTSSRMQIQALPAVLPARAASKTPLTVAVHERMEPLEALWRRLEAQDGVSLHHGYDWCRAWLKTNPEPLLVLHGTAGGRDAFLLPLTTGRRRGNRVARFVAGAYSNINTGLIAADAEVDPDTLAAALKGALKGRVDLLSLENMPLLWRGALSPFAALPHTQNQNRAFQLPLLAAFEDTLKQVNAKRRRKKFRLQQRRLEDAGGYRIIEAATRAERHALLSEFFRQKASRFRSHGLPDVFRGKSVQDFFHALADLEGRQDGYALKLHALALAGGHEGEMLAVAGTSRKGDHVICQFGSIREDLLADTSPGEFLFWHVIEAAGRDGAKLFDFGIGDQPYKRSWCTIETVQYDVLLPVTLTGHFAAGLHRASVRAKAAVKANPAAYAAIQRWRAGSGSNGAERSGTADEE